MSQAVPKSHIFSTVPRATRSRLKQQHIRGTADTNHADHWMRVAGSFHRKSHWTMVQYMRRFCTNSTYRHSAAQKDLKTSCWAKNCHVHHYECAIFINTPTEMLKMVEQLLQAHFGVEVWRLTPKWNLRFTIALNCLVENCWFSNH